MHRKEREAFVSEWSLASVSTKGKNKTKVMAKLIKSPMTIDELQPSIIFVLDELSKA
jgi:hypothetical protein